jgi:hypothetical protein
MYLLLVNVIRKELNNRLHDSSVLQGLAGGWRFRYSVYQVHRKDPPPNLLFSAKAGNEPAFPWASLPGGVFIVTSTRDPKLLRTYDPTQEADTILTEASTLDPEDDETLLRFLNKWGLLGLVAPDNAVQFWDSVFQTRHEVGRIKRLAGWLGAMKAGRWRSGSLPSMSEVRKLVPDIPRQLTLGGRSRAYWLAFANELNQALWGCPVRAILLSEGHSVRRHFLPRCLRDVLYLTLWRYASDEDAVLRECLGCHGLFSVSRTNNRKCYCSWACKNRATVRRWRKNKLGQGKRRSRT